MKASEIRANAVGEAPTAGCFGHCADCDRIHALPEGNARALALDLMREFATHRRLDLFSAAGETDPRLSFDHLFPEGVGNMFGVLECRDARGESVVLRAFSSLRDGIRQVEGWVLPVLPARVYEGTILPAQEEIKRLTEVLAGEAPGSSERKQIESQRRDVSRSLWNEMCQAYRFRNFRGHERGLAEAVLPGTPITGGMGECCAPKLLNHAARHGLRPVSLAEFYWEGGARPTPAISLASGRGRSGREAGAFYPSCEARCQPLLGFLLCGLES